MLTIVHRGYSHTSTTLFLIKLTMTKYDKVMKVRARSNKMIDILCPLVEIAPQLFLNEDVVLGIDFGMCQT